MTLDIEGSLDASLELDADLSAEGVPVVNTVSIEGSIDASATADLDISLTFSATPGIPFMPATDDSLSVEKTCSIGYDGTAKFDMDLDMSTTGNFNDIMMDEFEAPEPVHYDDSASGAFDATFVLEYDSGTNKATAPALLNGGWAMMMDVDELELSGIGGTRSVDLGTTATYDPEKGIYTTYEPYFGPADDVLGGTSLPFVGSVDTSSVDMTLEPVSKEDAESFNEEPGAFLEDEGVSMPSGGSFPWVIVLAVVAIVAVVVVVLVLLMMKKKKAAKFNQHPMPYQEQGPVGGQPQYQQYPPQQPPYGQAPPQGEYPPQQPPVNPQ
jgi:hypothetical protein